MYQYNTVVQSFQWRCALCCSRAVYQDFLHSPLILFTCLRLSVLMFWRNCTVHVVDCLHGSLHFTVTSVSYLHGQFTSWLIGGAAVNLAKLFLAVKPVTRIMRQLYATSYATISHSTWCLEKRAGSIGPWSLNPLQKGVTFCNFIILWKACQSRVVSTKLLCTSLQDLLCSQLLQCLEMSGIILFTTRALTPFSSFQGKKERKKNPALDSGGCQNKLYCVRKCS